MTRRAVLLGLVAAALIAGPAAADGPVRVGDVAPDFALRDQDGRTVRLGDFRGRPVVLAFIVKSFTGG